MIYDKYLGKYCLVRSNPAGVFAGVLEAVEGDACILSGARRIYYWAGAFTLSQFCQEGVKLVDRCKFSNEVPEQGILGTIEILPCSDAAIESIKGVPVWKVQKDEFGRYIAAMTEPIQQGAAKQDFLTEGYGDGDADGCGDIHGNGGEGYGLQITELGFGDGSGSGSGHGYGDGTGDGSGCTIGKGAIDGYGSEWTDFLPSTLG